MIKQNFVSYVVWAIKSCSLFTPWSNRHPDNQKDLILNLKKVK